jgi:hypothetical protein
MYYRFSNGLFSRGETFKEAKENAIESILSEKENSKSWHKCTCVGFDHYDSCPQHWSNRADGEIPF